MILDTRTVRFQSSFELTGYITGEGSIYEVYIGRVSKLFRAYGLYNSAFVRLNL